MPYVCSACGDIKNMHVIGQGGGGGLLVVQVTFSVTVHFKEPSFIGSFVIFFRLITHSFAIVSVFFSFSGFLISYFLNERLRGIETSEYTRGKVFH